MAISKSTDSHSIPTPSPLFSANIRTNAFSLRYQIGWLLLLALLLCAACGPEKSGQSQEELLAETQQIALTYQADGNLEQARTQLNALKVANPSQWLVYVAETVIAENHDSKAMTALVHLANDLGLQSEPISKFSLQHNLLKSVAAIAPDTTQKNSADVQAPVGPPEQAPLPASVVTPTIHAPVAALSSTPSATTQATLTNAGPLTQTAKTQSLANTLILTPTATTSAPVAKADSVVNVRSGPGTDYPVIGELNPAEAAAIVAKNQTGDWWEITFNTDQQGWVLSQLVETSGELANLAVAANIPPPPPTATAAPATDTPTPQPVAEQPTATTQATAAPQPATSGNDFVVIQKHLWDVVENGGQLDGPSVTCGQARELVVNVVDANGNRLNGVAVQVQYGAKEIYVTGAQGKGDGVAEFVLGSGQDVKVIKDTDGREVTSDVAAGLTTRPWDIPYETLIGGHFCTDDASCKSFVDHTGCYGHFSWTVTFKRQR